MNGPRAVTGILTAGLRGIALAACALVAAPAAATVSITSFLAGVDRENASTAAGRSAGGFAGVPYVRDLEFRIRNEAFDFGRQRYSVQLSPKGFGEEGASRRFVSALSGRGAAAHEALRNSALKSRYGIVLDDLEGSVLAGVHDRLADLEQERIRVLERQSVTDAFDLGDILRSETSLSRHRERAEEARARALQARARARALAGEGAEPLFDTLGLVSVEAVLARLDDLSAALPEGAVATDTDNVHLREARDDAAAADAQYQLALAETRRFISFVEFSYDNGNRRNELDDRARGREYDLDRAYLVEVGFRLPWLGGDRSAVVRRRAEKVHRQAELRAETEELAADLREEIRTLRALGARYAALEARDAELDIPARLRRYAGLGAADPLVVLTLRQAQWENALRREEVRFEILRRYIEAADMAGALARRPARNLLSANGEPLAP